MEFLEPKKNPSGVLRFTPYAYAKILFMRDAGDTEIGGYGISGTDDPMLVTDFCLVKQKCTSISVDLDEEDSINFVERMMDNGIAPWQCQRIWIHTHPGNCPNPSGADEDNFDTNFSLPDCAIFYILANEGKEYVRMRFNVSPGIDVDIRSEVDYSFPFESSNQPEWKKEYEEKVTKEEIKMWGKNDKSSITDLIREHNSRIMNGSTTTVDDLKDELSPFYESGDSIFYEDDEEYFEFNRKLERFYDEKGRRIKDIKAEWVELITDYLEDNEEEQWKEAFREMEGQYESIVSGTNC